MKCYGVINENGEQIHFIGYWGKMVVLNWLDDESLKKIKEDRDLYDFPICDYFKPQPDNLGKLIWIAGMQLLLHIKETINCNMYTVQLGN